MLDGLLKAVPDTLVDATSRTRLSTAYAQLPPGIAGTIGLEARLRDDRQVDLFVHVATEQQLLALAKVSRDGLPALGPDGRWSHVADLADRSLEITRSKPHLWPAIWLEFDLGVDAGPLIPGVFAPVGPDPELSEPTQSTATTIDEICSVARAAGRLDGLDCVGLGDAILRIIEGGLRIKWAGIFPGRKEHSSIRLNCAARLPPDLVVNAVVRGGWPGAREAFARWTNLCMSFSDRIYLDVDVTRHGLSPRIGIDISFKGHPSPREEARWSGLLYELERADLCTEAKRIAIEQLGVDYSAGPLGKRCRQFLNNAKVTVDATGDVGAKIYFGASELVEDAGW